MSRKLATTIKDSAIPGKYKRVLEAYAAFANNDGTNIYPRLEKLAYKGGVSRWTIQRQTPDLLACKILRRAEKHTCKIIGCTGGSTHYCGHPGKWSNAYEIDMNMVQNATNYLGAICSEANGAKCRKPNGANCPTDSGITDSCPAVVANAPPLGGQTPNSPAVPAEKGREGGSSFASLTTEVADLESEKLEDLSSVKAEQDQKQNQPPTPEEEALMCLVQPIHNHDWSEKEIEAIRYVMALCARMGFAPEHILRYNWVHKSGRLYIRTPHQFAAAIQGDEDGEYRLLNEYMTHDRCKLCSDAKPHFQTFRELQSWKQVEEAEQQRQRNIAAEETRMKALAELDFRSLSTAEQEAFKPLRGDGWQPGVLGKRIRDGSLDEGTVSATVRLVFKDRDTSAHSEPEKEYKISWELFQEIMEHVTRLQQPMATE